MNKLLKLFSLVAVLGMGFGATVQAVIHGPTVKNNTNNAVTVHYLNCINRNTPREAPNLCPVGSGTVTIPANTEVTLPAQLIQDLTIKTGSGTISSENRNDHYLHFIINN